MGVSDMGSISIAARPHFFEAVPTPLGFDVHDTVVPDRVYAVPKVGTPTLNGRMVTNSLTLERINAAVDEWVEGALLAEIEAEIAA
jgi:hypothetical protein